MAELRQAVTHPLAHTTIHTSGHVIEQPLRIALFTHSVNPRGGVVHTLELAEALHAAGHHVTVFAPATAGQRLFRDLRCDHVLVPVPEAMSFSGGLEALVEQRISALVERLPQWLAPNAPGSSQGDRFDVLHAQDSITANALATLQERGVIGPWLRTVHHLDSFRQPRLNRWQLRGFAVASQVYVVSELWRDRLRRDYRVHARLVPNGVNLQRFQPRLGAQRSDAEHALAQRLGLRLDAGPIWLAVGGVEARKNSHRILQAFAQLREHTGTGQLVMAGGASLLEHGEEQARFDAVLEAHALSQGPGGAVLCTGPLADADMPALFRLADALLLPSLNEGFGLVVLEALASGTPAVVSRIAPFTDYLAQDEVCWCDPLNADSIAQAMQAAAQSGRRPVPAVCERFSWSRSAESHLAWYRLDCTAQRLRDAHQGPEYPHLQESAPCPPCTTASAGPTRARAPAIRPR